MQWHGGAAPPLCCHALPAARRGSGSRAGPDICVAAGAAEGLEEGLPPPHRQQDAGRAQAAAGVVRSA
eukprot:1573590-Pyramimonas_sp.AAC.1